MGPNAAEDDAVTNAMAAAGKIALTNRIKGTLHFTEVTRS
jgi:hypothetical protein